MPVGDESQHGLKYKLLSLKLIKEIAKKKNEVRKCKFPKRPLKPLLKCRFLIVPYKAKTITTVM